MHTRGQGRLEAAIGSETNYLQSEYPNHAANLFELALQDVAQKFQEILDQK